MTDLRSRLRALGLTAILTHLDDLVALATKQRWSPTQLLEHLADLEEKDRARRGLERCMSRSRLDKFKPMSDFDWNCPTQIDRSLVESVLTLDFLDSARNVILVAPGMRTTFAGIEQVPVNRWIVANQPVANPV